MRSEPEPSFEFQREHNGVAHLEKPPTRQVTEEKDTDGATSGDMMEPEFPTSQPTHTPPSKSRENLILLLLTLTQLVQISPLGIGINSGLAIGEALGASRVASTWVVASFPLTQGSFVLIGMCQFRQASSGVELLGYAEIPCLPIGI